MTYPSISVITPTFNSEKTIAKCLSSIRGQTYPQNKVKIIIIDGGSKDNTLSIIKKYDVRLLQVNPKEQNVEFNKLTGIRKAKGEILLMLDHDNILPHKNLLKKLVQPFIDHKEVVGVETTHYHYDRRMTMLDRYFALFGVTDPLAFYLGKADRMPYWIDGYDSKYFPKNYGGYFIVDFNENNIPTIGANGFLVRRKILLNNANITREMFFPIDVNVDLIKKGFNRYAFVKDSISHIAGHGNVSYYLKRRMMFVKQYHLSKKNLSLNKARRYSVYQEEDLWKLIYFIVISLTIVKPMIDSIRGYFKIPDVAWFIHPILCFGFVIMYTYVIVEHKLVALKNSRL